jgi:hypothetical protein
MIYKVQNINSFDIKLRKLGLGLQVYRHDALLLASRVVAGIVCGCRDVLQTLSHAIKLVRS